MTVRIALGLLVAIVVPGCQRDPAVNEPPREGTIHIMSAEEVPKSQRGTVSQQVANTNISIAYSRPVARGRVLFGSLVPYGEVWHPGADRATTITFTRDVHLQDRPLPAGTYSLWTIPRPDTWTVIFSKAADVYHMPYPGEQQDALRLDVGVDKGPHVEVLTLTFASVEGKEAILQLQWGDVIVPISIRVP